MSTAIYRYEWNGVSAITIKQSIDPASAASIVIAPTVPTTTVDITMTDTQTNKDDLDSVMTALGWSFLTIV